MDNQRLKTELKTLTSVDILEHRAVIKFCVQAGKSPMETNRFLDANGDGPRVSIFIEQRLTIVIRGLKMEELIF